METKIIKALNQSFWWEWLEDGWDICGNNIPCERVTEEQEYILDSYWELFGGDEPVVIDMGRTSDEDVRILWGKE